MNGSSHGDAPAEGQQYLQPPWGFWRVGGVQPQRLPGLPRRLLRPQPEHQPRAQAASGPGPGHPGNLTLHVIYFCYF